MHTIGPDPFLAPIVYIITGNRQTERLVREAVLAAGYPAEIINVDAISPVIAPLGNRPEGHHLYLCHAQFCAGKLGRHNGVYRERE